jgi:hypothetical protein
LKGLEDNVDGFAAACARVRVGGGACEVGDQERPAHEAEELDERSEHADGRGESEQGGVGVVDGA